MIIKETLDRKKGIGGGDIAAIMGQSKFRTAIDVWEVKTGRKSWELNMDFRTRKAFHMEAFMLDEYMKKTDMPFFMFKDVSIKSPENPLFQGHLDGLTVENPDRDGTEKILECKTVRYQRRDEFGEDGTNQFPFDYILQCAWYSSILKIDTDLIALFGDEDEIHIYEYKRDLELEKLMHESAMNFWDKYVSTDTMPPVQTNEDLAKFYPRSNGKLKETSIEMFEKTRILKQLKLDISAMQKECEELEGEIKTEIGDDEGLEYEGLVAATWKSYETDKFYKMKFELEKPEIYKEYCKKATQRRFLVK